MPAPKDPIKYAEWKAKLSKFNSQKTLSEEHKRKIGLSKLGKKRKPFSKEWKAKMRINFLKRNWVGENSPSWKGNKVGYKGVHNWVYKQLGVAKKHSCSNCDKTGKQARMEWANLDGKYTRDLTTWVVMCAKCHKIYDQEKFGSFSKTKETKKLMSLASEKRKRSNNGTFL